jgi:hypothetical protein
VLRVAIPFIPGPKRSAKADEDALHLEMRFDLATGRLVPVEEKMWSSAMAAARTVNDVHHKAEMIAQARFIAPLTGPHGNAERDWYGYLLEVFFRLDPDWKDGFPTTQVLRWPQSPDYQVSVGFLRGALHDELRQHGAFMIASPSQDNLVRVLTELGPGVRRGWLKHARVYVVVDAAHKTAVAKALTRSGAEFIPLDPARPIPQRKSAWMRICTKSEHGEITTLERSLARSTYGRRNARKLAGSGLMRHLQRSGPLRASKKLEAQSPDPCALE